MIFRFKSELSSVLTSAARTAGRLGEIAMSRAIFVLLALTLNLAAGCGGSPSSPKEEWAAHRLEFRAELEAADEAADEAAEAEAEEAKKEEGSSIFGWGFFWFCLGVMGTLHIALTLLLPKEWGLETWALRGAGWVQLILYLLLPGAHLLTMAALVPSLWGWWGPLLRKVWGVFGRAPVAP